MACLAMETEKTFLEILSQVDNYNVSDSSLSFDKGDGAFGNIFTKNNN